MSLNSIIQVNVTAETPPVTAAAFGTPAVLANPGQTPGLTPRVTFYSTASAVEAARVAGDLLDPIAKVLSDAISQTPHTPLVAVLKGDDTGAVQEIVWTVGGTIVIGETFTVALDGFEFTHTALVGLLTPDDIAAALAAGLVALVAAESINVSVVGFGATVTITADSLTDFFDYYQSTDSAAGTLVVAATETGIDVAGSLGLALAESTAWYGLALQSFAEDHNAAGATWTEANKRFFIAQSNDPAILTASTVDIASALKALSLLRTGVLYHPVADQQVAFNWESDFLSTDPDTGVTIAAQKTLELSTPNDISDTQLVNLDFKNANIYDTLFGQGSTWSGRMAGGEWMDIVLTTDWVTARAGEAWATLFLQESNAGRRVFYNDAGIEQAASVLRGVLLFGEGIGHFNPGGTRVIKPLAANIPDAIKATRKLTLEFEAERTGAIQGGTINGTIVFQLSA